MNAETEKQIFLEMASERFVTKPTKHQKFSRENCNQSTFDPSNFRNLTKEDIVKLLGRKWKTQLCLLGSFFEEYKHLTSNYIADKTHPVSILSLGTTSRNLLSIYKDKSKVSRVLKILQKIGGLVKVDDTYRFSSFGCQAKRYAYNKHTERCVLSLVQQYHINIMQSHTHVSLGITFADDFKFDPEQYYKIRVSSKLKVAHITEEQAIQILNKRYEKLIQPRLHKIEELNAVLPPERRIRLRWNLHFSKTGFLTKVGIRATSQIVSLKEHENENLGYTGKWRKDYLREIGFDKDSFDVHGSIYQITHLLNTGDPITNEIDPYREMFGPMTDEERAVAKSMAMPLYFDRPNCILNHMKDRIPETWKRYGGKAGLQYVINDYCDKMFRYTGKSLDSEVFLHESLIYLDFVYALWKEHAIDCVQIYDGFYFSKKMNPKLLESVLQACCSSYYQDYHAFIHVSLGITFAKEESNNMMMEQEKRKKSYKKQQKFKRIQESADLAVERAIFRDKERRRQQQIIEDNNIDAFMKDAAKGFINHKDLQILMDCLGITIVTAQPCSSGFSPSAASQTFKRYVVQKVKEQKERMK